MQYRISVQLIERPGVCRTAFREVPRRPAAVGLVIVPPSRGSAVRKLSVEDVLRVLEIPGHLESRARKLACARACDAKTRALVDLLILLMACRSGFDRKRY